MATLLGASDWPDVRAALDSRLTADLLPDRVIGSPIYATEARRRVLKRVPNYGSLDAEQQETLRTAAIYLLASMVAPAVPIIVREQDKDYSYQREAPDFGALATALSSRADELLAELSGDPVGATDGVSWMFGRASGCRGV